MSAVDNGRGIPRRVLRVAGLSKRVGVLALATISVAASFTFFSVSGCLEQGPKARAKQITSRTELIGGSGALGEVGDFLLENDKVRVVIQGPGFSRGFGVYGGALIDADLQRPLPPGGQLGRSGRAQFGELFPIFFLQALVPDRVHVLSDGSDGGPARVRTRGTGGDFLTMTKTLNQVVLNSHDISDFDLTPDSLDGDPQVEYETIYELRPGDRFLTIRTKVRNISQEALRIPSSAASSLLGALFDDMGELEIPMGAVLLFGEGNKVFTPGAGFDMRFSLQDAYGVDLPFPAIPGILTRYLATASDNGVSYAFFTAPDNELKNFAANRLDEEGNNLYEQVYGVGVEDDSMLVPFLASAFTGVFQTQAPTTLELGGSFEFTSYFSIGDGGVASAVEPFYELRGKQLGRVRGRVFDESSLEPAAKASVVFLDEEGDPVSQTFTDDSGRFRARLPAGDYSVVVEDDPTVSEPMPLTVVADETRSVDLAQPSPARIAVTVLDELGRRLPARLTVVAEIEADRVDEDTRSWLFDLKVGQRWRASSRKPEAGRDLVRYVEGEGYTTNGTGVVDVRPGGPYTLYVSRGMEYDLEEIDLGKVEAGRAYTHEVVLRKTVDTSGYIAADFHVHASPSLDSDLDLVARVVSAAGEGIEFLASGDHNILTDLSPYLYESGLERWLRTTVGVELTTLEGGHFNAYPLSYDAGHVVRGSPEWALRPPQDIFDDLRALGAHDPEDTLVVVAHPRDSVLGYFAQHNLDPLTARHPDTEPDIMSPSGSAFFYEDGVSTFSWDFNAIEIFNGKRMDQLRTIRMPEDISEYDVDPDIIDELPEPGTILCNNDRVAWAGVLDDWFNFFNLGHRYAGIGNSDSHDDVEGSIGAPRSYVWVDQNDPFRVTDSDVVQGILNNRVIVSNGPFVELFVDGAPVGSDVVSESGEVDVKIRVQVPNFVDVTTVTLYGNGEPIHILDAVEFDDGLFEWETSLALDRDTWFIAEATGEKNLFPIVPPIEVPPVELGDAFEVIAEPLGFGGGVLGNLIPDRTGLVTPFAITNPVWVDVGGDGFEPPGVVARRCEGFGVVEMGSEESETAAVKADDSLIPSLWLPRVRGDLDDFRVLFDFFND